MFVGAVNKKICQQIVGNVPFDDWGKVFIGCSGSFRIEYCLSQKFPELRIFSNDVSLLSCAIGSAAMRRKMEVEFFGELNFLKPLATSDPENVLAACGVALEFAKYSPKNEFGRQRRLSVQANAQGLFEANRAKNRKIFEGLRLADFYPGDFMDQIERAREQGGGFCSFAPTYRGGYERMYKLLHENTKWEAPTYSMWDPKNTPALIDICEDAGVPYCILTDIQIEGREPKLLYQGGGHPVYVFSQGRSSLRRDSRKIQPFKYTPVDPEALTEHSRVEIAQIDSPRMSFLKTIYLAKGIKFVTGMADFLVLLDGRVAGGFTYTQSKFGDKLTGVYLLSDFALNGKRRLAKLIALMATSKSIIDKLNRRWLTRITEVSTTAFTDKPVSMKYRSIYKIANRGPAHINYFSEVRDLTPQGIYDLWWRKHAR